MSMPLLKKSLLPLVHYKRVRGLIDNKTANEAYQGFIEPYFSYCAPGWDGLGDTVEVKNLSPAEFYLSFR